jgi:hypothetical protein
VYFTKKDAGCQVKGRRRVRSQKGSLTLVRSQKPEGLPDDCQNLKENTLPLGFIFWLLASGF